MANRRDMPGGAHSGRHSAPDAQAPQSGRRPGASAQPASHDAGADVSAEAVTQRAHRRRKNRRVSNILLVIGIALLVLAGLGFGYIWYQYHEGKTHYATIQETSGVTEGAVRQVASSSDASDTLDVNWDALRAINSDLVGWIAIPDTVVNYPVVQTTDNSRYLTEAFDSSSGIYGAVFMDCDSKADLSDFHTVIYGHHLRNGQMFACLANYTDQSYFDEHPTVIYATPQATHRLTVIGAYAEQANDDMRTTTFSSAQSRTAYVQEQLGKCSAKADVQPSQVTHLYSLITCSYNTNDERTVVLCYEQGPVAAPARASVAATG